MAFDLRDVFNLEYMNFTSFTFTYVPVVEMSGIVVHKPIVNATQDTTSVAFVPFPYWYTVVYKYHYYSGTFAVD